jgi:hypothetical protein
MLYKLTLATAAFINKQLKTVRWTKQNKRIKTKPVTRLFQTLWWTTEGKHITKQNLLSVSDPTVDHWGQTRNETGHSSVSGPVVDQWGQTNNNEICYLSVSDPMVDHWGQTHKKRNLLLVCFRPYGGPLRANT